MNPVKIVNDNIFNDLKVLNRSTNMTLLKKYSAYQRNI